jgi:hypothetical protein
MEKFDWEAKPHDLEKFSNEEIYYLISSLLGLGFPGHSPERLYLSFKNDGGVGDIRFLLLSKDLLNANDTKEIVYFNLGQIDYEFNEVEIYSGRCWPEQMDPEKNDIDVSAIRTILNDQKESNVFRPVSFLKGLSRIISSHGFSERDDNHLFKLYWNSPLPDGIRSTFDFGMIGPMGTNYSGDYYLIAEPDEDDFGTTKVKAFKVFENDEDESEYIQEKIEVQHKIIDLLSVNNYENGEGELIAKLISQ